MNVTKSRAIHCDVIMTSQITNVALFTWHKDTFTTTGWRCFKIKNEVSLCLKLKGVPVLKKWNIL